MDKVTPAEVDRMLRKYLCVRPDLGLWNALAAQIFEAQSPFETQSRRKLQRWFVLFVVSSTAAIAAFAYFNFVN
jgi:hypothetical protein